MKSFNEFRATLSKDEIASIVGEAQHLNEVSREKYSENPESNLGNQIATISLGISLALLERYHTWLEQQD